MGLALREVLLSLVVTSSLAASGHELLLSPLIKEGKIQQAQTLAQVNDFIPSDNVLSYSGFITVNKKYNTNLFFWYFPAVNNPESAPVFLFNDGGPGASLMNALLAYVGPYKYNPELQAFDHRKNFSWNTDLHMIFLDNPAGVGFSFTDDEAGYPNSGQESAPDMYEFLQQFFQLFPDLQRNDFYNGGASFGGIYSTSLAHMIHEKNLDTQNPPKVKIALKGLILDSPWFHPPDQLDYSTVLYGFGLIDVQTKQELEKKQEMIARLLKENKLAEAGKLSMELAFKDVVKHTGYLLLHNIIKGTEGSPLLYNYTGFLERETTRRALHVGNRRLFLRGEKASARMIPKFMSSVKGLLEDLVDSGKYKVIALVGNLDVVSHHVGVHKVMNNLRWKGAEEFRSQRRNIWKNGKGQVWGYVKSYGNVSTVLVRNASHGCGIDQPQSVFELVRTFVQSDNLVEDLLKSGGPAQELPFKIKENKVPSVEAEEELRESTTVK